MKLCLQLLQGILLCLLVVPAFSAETIKIGAIYSKSGEAKTISEEFLIVTRFAIKEINSNGGVLGKQLELLEFDNESTGLGSRNAARRAVQEKVVAVLGPSWSSHALGSAPVLQKAGIPMLSPTATNPSVTLVGDYIFRICFIDSFQGRMLAKFAKEDLKAQRAVILINTGYVYSTDLADMFKISFQDLGGQVVKMIDYAEDSTNYSEMLQALQGISYDVVFIPGYTRDSAQIIDKATEMGLQTTFLGGDGWSHLMFDYIGDGLNGNYYLTHWDKTLATERSKTFVKKISHFFNFSKINAGMALSYDTVYLLADAIIRANSSNPGAIQEALASTTDFTGVTGMVEFDRNRNPIKPAVILQFQDRKTVAVKILAP